MCFGNSAAKKTQQEAERARRETLQREADRQAHISEGRTAIDTAFEQFNPDYYSGYQNAYTDYYNPQIEDQFERATGALTAALAGRGTLESTAGNRARSDLLGTYNTERTTIANDAVNAAKSLQGNVENAKTDLYALNQSAADPEAIGAQAQGRATSLVAPPTFSPLGEVFASFLQPYQAAKAAYDNRAGPRYTSPYTPTSMNSGRVVG